MVIFSPESGNYFSLFHKSTEEVLYILPVCLFDPTTIHRIKILIYKVQLCNQRRQNTTLHLSKQISGATVT